MAGTRALRRLLRVRELEEEQSRVALESAIADLRCLEHALAANLDRDRRGRALLQASAHTGDLQDRLAAMEESKAAKRVAAVIESRRPQAEEQVEQLREQYLAKRVERRQAETLIEEAAAREAVDADRRTQMGLDDWFRNRMHRR
jgi:flagellar biosynthesis chaperone FliJ